MRLTHLVKSRLVAVFAACVLLVIVLDLSTRGFAQQDCVPGTPPPSTDPTWKNGSEVTVIFDTNAHFTNDQRNAMTQACENWNASRGVNGSGVKFVGYTEGSKPAISTNVIFVRVGVTANDRPAQTLTWGAALAFCGSIPNCIG